MNLLNIGLLFTISAFLYSQEPVSGGDEPYLNATTATADSSTDVASISPATVPDPLTAAQKAKRRTLRLVEPLTLFSSALGSGLDQWRDTPPQWGQGSEGYARRFASAEGFTAAHNGIALMFDLGFHLDPRYRRMPGAAFGARLRNAVGQTFIANKDSGGKMINVSEIAGNFGAGFIANSWYPAGYNSAGDALTRGAFGLAYHTVKNVAREFLPDILHPGRRTSSGKGSH
jgi:hypothetical protein